MQAQQPGRSGKVRADRAVHAVTATFAASGAVMGANVARVPALRDQLAATESQLGLALVGAGIGSVLAMPFTARLVRRFGTGRVVVGGAVLVGAAWIGVGATTSVAVALAFFVLVGAGFGIWDVAMNVAGHSAEERDRRSWMPRLHAAFSGGAVLGAGLAALAVRAEMTPLLQFALVAIGSVVVVAVCVPRFLPVPEPPAERSGERSRTRSGSLWRVPAVLVIGLVVVGTTLGEGAANDWLALALVDTRGASQSLAALAFAGFNAAMLVGRLVGGGAIDRFGRTAVVRVCGATAAVGVLLLCLVPSLPVALLGALLWGLGLSVVFPAGMSAAGEAVPGRGAEAIAVVATIGYGGFLLGPPLLGFLAQAWGLDRALLVVAALAALVALLAGALRDRRPAEVVRTAAEAVEEPAAC
ncbi:MAG TPA: MFS transporter [Jiangellales bacterium]|nr:MFS transporter [Jiangellales bacterium]